jgi:hypothetical protein
MIIENWKIVIQQLPGLISNGIWFTRSNGIERQFLSKDGSIITHEPGGSSPEPFLTLEPELLQELVNGLAKNGFKPQEGRLEGELEATKKHLIDLRQLLKLK